MDLFNPQLSVQLGSYIMDAGIKIEVNSSQDSYFDWAKIAFTEQFQPELSIARREPSFIQLGYDGVLEEIFTGYVAKPYDTGSLVNEILLKDEMLLLEEIRITNTFLDTTPQEMISYFLAQAGIQKMKLSPQAYPKRRQLAIREMTLLQAIQAVHAAWGIRPRFFFSAGVFYWGAQPEQQKVYSFEYGINILSLVRLGGVWELQTISAPFVKHSHKIIINHPKVSGTFEVSKVVFQSTEEGFIRTYISFN